MRASAQTPATFCAYYDRQTTGDIDRAAWRAMGDSDGYRLMHRAARSGLALARTHWPSASGIRVLCGFGNNAGDGYAFAALASNAGIPISVFAMQAPTAGEAARAYAACRQAGVTIYRLDAFVDIGVDDQELIVDALVGTGLSRPLEGDMAAVVNRVNQLDNPVLALDVPSGLDADTGFAAGPCVQADRTLSFIAPKIGLFTGAGPKYTGTLHLDDLGIAPTAFTDARPVAIDAACASGDIAPLRRIANAHKGTYGHVLVVAGNYDMGGAGILAGGAALRAGSGLVSLATRGQHQGAALAQFPELMVHGLDDPAQLNALMARASVIAIGPGLGRDEWAQRCLATVLETALPVVIDADALTLLAASREVSPGPRVLTPHPGEARRLLGCNARAIEADRRAAVRAISELYAAIALLKGAGTLVASPHGDPMHLVSAGNPGMATGGMGDVLTGIIAALIAQGVSPHTAAVRGAHWHAVTADQVVRQRAPGGLLARDVIDRLPASRSALTGD